MLKWGDKKFSRRLVREGLNECGQNICKKILGTGKLMGYIGKEAASDVIKEVK